MLRKLVFLIIYLFCLSSVFGQNLITGQIIDVYDSLPLSNRKVEWLKNGTLIAQTLTNDSGNFQFSTIKNDLSDSYLKISQGDSDTIIYLSQNISQLGKIYINFLYRLETIEVLEVKVNLGNTTVFKEFEKIINCGRPCGWQTFHSKNYFWPIDRANNGLNEYFRVTGYGYIKD